jgi:hypothetical protein
MLKISRILILASFLVSFLHAPVAQAVFTSPLGIAIVPPLQFPHSTFSVSGARVSVLWGAHSNVYGIDVGVLGNITDNKFVGIAVSGVANVTKADATIIGLQAAGIANMNQKAHVYGLQVAAVLNYNYAESSLVGFQVALGNYSPFMTVTGAQIGIYNQARTVYGFQIGLVNYVENLHGLQIGLVNFNPNGIFAVAPILNVGF